MAQVGLAIAGAMFKVLTRILQTNKTPYKLAVLYTQISFAVEFNQEDSNPGSLSPERPGLNLSFPLGPVRTAEH